MLLGIQTSTALGSVAFSWRLKRRFLRVQAIEEWQAEALVKDGVSTAVTNHANDVLQWLSGEVGTQE